VGELGLVGARLLCCRFPPPTNHSRSHEARLSASVPTLTDESDRLTWVEWVLRLFTEVRAGEGRVALVMFANVFLILCAYYFIKPLREGWIAASGTGGLTKLELRAYTAFGQSLLLVHVVAGYGRLVGRWPRTVLIERATLFCMANMVIFWALQPGFPTGVPGMGIVFYLWVGIFSVFVVAQFWAFAADLYTEERGERMLPVIAIGATAGAAFGSLVLEKLVSTDTVPTQHVLLIALVPLGISIWLTRIADASEGAVPAPPPKARPAADRRGALRLVFGTKLLLAVGLIMLLANWVKTTGENQLYDLLQTNLAAEATQQGITGEAVKAFVKERTTAFYGTFFFWVNVAALVLQAFVASRVLKYGGFAAIFLLLPVMGLFSYAARAIVPALWVVRSMQIPVNAIDYSIQNTARHVLWLPMSPEVTFKGKPTIDSLFVRAGDGMAALTVLVGGRLASTPAQGYFGLNVALVVVWLAAAVWVVRRHRTSSASTHPPENPPQQPGERA
jgi:AAA family ATP:ADP antiporter